MIPPRKKRETRKSVQQSAWITLDGGFATRPCIVLDLSSAGAKIRVDNPSSVQARLRLAFARDARTGRIVKSCGDVGKRSASSSSDRSVQRIMRVPVR